ncbi:uncharacterized protein LOC122252328 [Penaeus japonicus]|uniref:uncharacterized protein LOC122252328 n=1 Tax=Penaeus japonicus TaxID=27405 RepID=UPI001C7140C2|nr:uncharacterized protein LOC122252328 [Penaeus japonicus]
MERARSRIRPEIGNVQYGFVQDAGTRNAIWMVRMLSERAIEMQKDLFMCFIDYTKAFDKVQHEELLRLLQGLDLDGKDIRLIRNLYWEQKACMRVDNNTSKYTPICRGVRQGCALSPDLFNLYSETILRQLEDMPGFIHGGHNINLRYTDDTVLIAESRDNLQELLDKMQQVEKFNYLGSLITDDGKCDREIKKRTGMAKDAFQKLGKILKDRKMPTDTKLRVLDCYVNSILTYGCECWTISTQMERRLEAVEMWFLRRIFRISWVDHQARIQGKKKDESEHPRVRCAAVVLTPGREQRPAAAGGTRGTERECETVCDSPGRGTRNLARVAEADGRICILNAEKVKTEYDKTSS